MYWMLPVNAMRFFDRKLKSQNIAESKGKSGKGPRGEQDHSLEIVGITYCLKGKER